MIIVSDKGSLSKGVDKHILASLKAQIGMLAIWAKPVLLCV